MSIILQTSLSLKRLKQVRDLTSQCLMAFPAPLSCPEDGDIYFLAEEPAPVPKKGFWRTVLTAPGVVAFLVVCMGMFMLRLANVFSQRLVRKANLINISLKTLLLLLVLAQMLVKLH